MLNGLELVGKGSLRGLWQDMRQLSGSQMLLDPKCTTLAIQKIVQDPGFTQDLKNAKLDLEVFSPEQAKSMMSMLLGFASGYKEVLSEGTKK
jgi:hypothetical protein